MAAARHTGGDVGLQELQRTIDTSLATASPLARRVYANHTWSAERLQRFINRVMAATVATVRPDGRPHAAVVLAACCDGIIYFAVSPGSRLLRNLERGNAVAMTMVDRHHDVTIHGEARLLGDTSGLAALLNDLHALSPRGQFVPPDWDGSLWTLDPERIFLST